MLPLWLSEAFTGPSLSLLPPPPHIHLRVMFCAGSWGDKFRIACLLSTLRGNEGTLRAARGGETFRWRGYRVQTFGRIGRKGPLRRVLVGVTPGGRSLAQ